MLWLTNESGPGCPAGKKYRLSLMSYQSVVNKIRRHYKMKGQTTRVLRIVLLVYAIYYVLYGSFHVLFPEVLGPKFPALERIIGAAMLAFAFCAELAYREKTWDRVKPSIQVIVFWMILYIITMAWGILTGEIPAEAWIFVIIGAVFTALLAFLYFREKRMQG